MDNSKFPMTWKADQRTKYILVHSWTRMGGNLAALCFLDVLGDVEIEIG